MEETELGKLMKVFYETDPITRNQETTHDNFKNFMQGKGYEQVELSKGDTRIIIEDTFGRFRPDDREMVYFERPIGCVVSHRNIKDEDLINNRKIGDALRKLFGYGKGTVERIRGGARISPYWIAKIDDDPMKWSYVGGKSIRVDVRNDGNSDITNKCFIIV